MKKGTNPQINTAKLLTTINLALAALVLPNAPAQALQLNFTYAPGTNTNVINGFRTAGNIWSSQLSDDTTVNIYVGFGQLSNTNALGGTRPAMVRVNYSDYLNHYFRDINSADDLMAFQNLQIDSEDQADISNILQVKTLTQANAAEINNIKNLLDFDKKSAFSMLDNANKIKNNNKKIWLTSANAKSLNLISSNQWGFDAQIMMNNNSNWDFSRVYNPTLTTIDPNKYDFLSVALHEIGHALGFVSGVDAFTVLTNLSATSGSNSTEDQDSDYVTPLDLVRYSDQSKISKIPDFSTQGNKFFSIDGGATNLANFDGTDYQSSHWQAANNVNSEIGIMNPTIAKGQVLNISALDLRLLDVIGWNRGSNFLTSNTMMGNLDANQENMLINTSVFDSGITRSGSSSVATGVRYWQENISYMEASEYMEPQFMEGEMVENAPLDELFKIEHNHGDEDHASVPEPNAIAGLGVMSLWGIGKLFQRRRKSTKN